MNPKNNYFKFLLLTFCFFLISSCKKDPTVDFDFIFPDNNAKYYYEGEVVQLNNKSKDAKKYKWTLPDGSVKTEKEPIYRIPENLSTNRYLEFTLTASNKKSSQTITRTLVVSKRIFDNDFVKLDTMVRKPKRKYFRIDEDGQYLIEVGEKNNIYPLPSYALLRIKFFNAAPKPGNYLIGSPDFSLSIGVIDHYKSEFELDKTQTGFVTVNQESGDRLSLSFDQLKFNGQSNTGAKVVAFGSAKITF